MEIQGLVTNKLFHILVKAASLGDSIEKIPPKVLTILLGMISDRQN